MAWGDQAWRLLTGRPGGVRRSLLADVLRAVAGALREPVVARTPPADAAPPPTAGVALLDVAAIPADGLTEARLAGETVAVCRVGDEVFVVENTCPHAGGPLGDGTLTGHALVCPNHGWSFDVRTGVCAVSPETPLRRWKAWIAGGKVLVDPVALPPVA